MSSPFAVNPQSEKKRLIKYTRPWLYPMQEEAIFYPRDCNGKPARYSCIEATTKSGKTVGCIAWLFERALYGKENQHYWWVAPVFKQAAIAFNRMKAAYPKGTFIINVSNLTLTVVASGSIIEFKSAEKPDNLYGEDVYAAVYDEASRGREESWHALRSTLTATRGPVRFIGNVKGRRNWFYALCRKAEHGAAGMSYHKIVAADAVAAGILAAEEIEDARSQLPEQVFNELYNAIPSDDGGNPFGLRYIESCVKPISGRRPVAFGVDLAKSVDWTVVIGLDDNGVTSFFDRWQGPWATTIERVQNIIGSAPTLIDSTGVGDPVVELMQKKLGTNIEGYYFSSQAKQKIMEGLAVEIQSGRVGYPEGVIKDELEDFEYTYTKTGVRYSAPEGFHDDTVCALALAVECRRTNSGLEVWRKLGAAA